MTTKEDKYKINLELNKYFIQDLSNIILEYIPFFFGEIDKILIEHKTIIRSSVILPDGRLCSGSLDKY